MHSVTSKVTVAYGTAFVCRIVDVIDVAHEFLLGLNLFSY